MKKKLDKQNKDKSDNQSQLKSLFGLFTEQRKVLDASIKKTQMLEEEFRRE